MNHQWILLLQQQRRSYISFPSSLSSLLKQTTPKLPHDLQKLTLNIKLVRNTVRSRISNNRKILSGKLASNTHYQSLNSRYQSLRNKKSQLKSKLSQQIQHKINLEAARREWFDSHGYPLTTKLAGRYVNPWAISATEQLGNLDYIKWRLSRLMNANVNYTQPLDDSESNKYLPAVTVKDEDLVVDTFGINGNKLHARWIGHATCLVQLHGFTVLTDPVFEDDISPVSTVNSIRRMVESAVSIRQMSKQGMKVDAVLLSHDHYDHLNIPSLIQLEESGIMSQGVYYVPMGHKELLMEEVGIDENKIKEFNWWQECEVTQGDRSLVVTCAPAQHWCSRTPFDRNKRLWCSWAVRATSGGGSSSPSSNSFYFAGDTGLPKSFPLHQQIGVRLGPFDLAALPIGAYSPGWFNKTSHCSAREAVKLHSDLQANASLAIHWGTFALADEPYFEPPRMMQEAAEERGLQMGKDIFVLRHGDAVSVSSEDDQEEESNYLVDPHPVLHASSVL